MDGRIKLHMAFVDDSGQPVRGDLGPLVSLGAVVMAPEALDVFSDSVSKVRTELKVPVDVEVKWSPKKGDWLLASENRSTRTALYESVLDAAIDCGAKSIVVVWDRGAVEWDESDVKREILKWLYERCSFCLESFDNKSEGVYAKGVVIADIPGGDRRDEKQWLAETLELTSYGTEYVQCDRIRMPILTGWSHHVPHLQVADIVTSMTTAALAGSSYAQKFVPRLLKLAYVNKYGYLSGAGLKFFPPDSLGNLYHYVFNQQTAWENRRVDLPYAGWKFAKGAQFP
jgi:hypothetical protein